MVRAKGHYRNQTQELDQPLALPEGAAVEVDVYLPEDSQDPEGRGWTLLGMSRLEEE